MASWSERGLKKLLVLTLISSMESPDALDDEPKAQVARTTSNVLTCGALIVTSRLSRKAPTMRVVTGVGILKLAISTVTSRGMEGREEL